MLDFTALPRSVLFFASASVCLLTAPPSAQADDSAADSLHSVAEFQQAILGATGQARSLLCYDMMIRIDDGRIVLEAGPELDTLVRFLAEQLESPDAPGGLPIGIADFLAKHPHPAARDALWRASASENGAIRSSARKALVALRDERVLDLLLDDIRQGRSDVSDPFRMIGELGSPRAIKPLEEIVANPASTDAYREAARRALRDVRLRVEAGIVTPFDLDDRTHAALAREGFAILPEVANELYEHLGSEYPYITVDVVFHAFMILARASFDDLELLVLRPRLSTFASGMTTACLAQVNRLRPEREVQLCYRNAAVFGVVSALLEGRDVEARDLPLISLAREELAKIRAHHDVAPSSLFAVREDFTKYEPRGRHGGSAEMGAYFQAMLYLGRMTFRIDDDAETQRALLLLDVLESNADLHRQWAEIDALLGQFFGELDDPGVQEYLQALGEVLPTRTQGRALAVMRDSATLQKFRAHIRKHPAPRILTMVPERADPATRERSRGFRVFGQRYTRAIDVFQQWMEGSTERGSPSLPSGLHVASALLGSDEAERILRKEGRPTTLKVVSVPPSPVDPLSSLGEAYLFCFSPLFERSKERPPFMQRAAWEKRMINSSLGGWAEVVHATMLYSKDANYYMGMSAMLDRFHGYVDPYPEFFSRLGQLTDRFVQSLDACGFFDRLDAEIAPVKEQVAGLPKDLDAYKERTRLQEASIRPTRDMFTAFRAILPRLEEIARKELRGEGQSVSDGVFLKSLHRTFKHLAFNWSNSDHHHQSMALVSDPATDYYTRQCLEVGIGRPLVMYVTIPFEGQRFVCRGPVYSYYEFLRPIEDRLDDETWRLLCRDVGSDPLPWIARFPELGFARRASREELEELLRLRTPDGRMSSGGGEPWMASQYDDPTRGLVAAEVAADDLPLLLQMADQDTIHVAVRAFALQRLRDFGTRPEVLAAYRRQLAVCETQVRDDHLFHARLHNTIVGLGYCGEKAQPELTRAEAVLKTTPFWKWRQQDLADHYRLLLAEARRRIAQHPHGITKSSAGANLR